MTNNKQNHSHILGINPGSRSLGLAVLKYGVLVDWRVKEFDGTWNKAKLNKLMTTLTRFIRRYKVTVIALKKLHPARSSKALDSLVLSIERYARQNRLTVCQYSIDEMKSHVGNGESVNMMQLSEHIARSNNEVLSEFNQQACNKNKYYMTMFEAVALSLACQSKVGLQWGT